MIILVVNCGSSSLKYQLIDMENENEKKAYEYLCELEITKISFERVVDDFAYKYLV